MSANGETETEAAKAPPHFPTAASTSANFETTWPMARGTATSPDGRKYVGEVRTNGKGIIQRNGQGTYIWPDGRKYVGEWRDDEPNGHGT
jgi:hypothetical protein